MTLYAIPFTCSLAVRLALAKHEVPHQLQWMGRFTHVLEGGERYDDLNPKRRVPALALSDGELLTEIPAILAHLDAAAQSRPDAERRRLLEWLCFIATELHRPSMFPLFDPAAPQATRDDALARHLPPVLDLLEGRLSAHPTLLGGDQVSAADFYLLWALLVLRSSYREHARRPALDAFVRRVTDLPWVTAVIADERVQLGRFA